MQTSQTVQNVAQWTVERSRKDDRLYSRFGRDLESDHTGEFVAISDDGDFFLGTNEYGVAVEAVRRFGSGNFALRRIGADAEVYWRALPT